MNPLIFYSIGGALIVAGAIVPASRKRNLLVGFGCSIFAIPFLLLLGIAAGLYLFS